MKVVVWRLLDGVTLVIECCHMVGVVVETMSRCRLNHQRGYWVSKMLRRRRRDEWFWIVLLCRMEGCVVRVGVWGVVVVGE